MFLTKRKMDVQMSVWKPQSKVSLHHPPLFPLTRLSGEDLPLGAFENCRHKRRCQSWMVDMAPGNAVTISHCSLMWTLSRWKSPQPKPQGYWSHDCPSVCKNRPTNMKSVKKKRQILLGEWICQHLILSQLSHIWWKRYQEYRLWQPQLDKQGTERM